MIAKVNNIELYYEKSGQGKPLILLHGNGETHKIFKRTISILNKHYTVYAVDFRNHGKSTQVSELHYADHVKDIYEFIVQMQIEKPVCYGFSDGGIVGLLLASEYPDLFSRLIVSGPNISPYGLKNSVRCYYKLYFALTGSSMI
ncbi:MAG: alpha/beta hydrolase, partial [Oscillospiraceae bacterium]